MVYSKFNIKYSILLIFFSNNIMDVNLFSGGDFARPVTRLSFRGKVKSFLGQKPKNGRTSYVDQNELLDESFAGIIGILWVGLIFLKYIFLLLDVLCTCLIILCEKPVNF